MSEIINSIFLNADYFVMLILRVGAIVVASPIFGRVSIPVMAKIGLVIVLAYLFFVQFPPGADIEYSSLFEFVLICVSEIFLGVALAFVTNVFFTLTYISGHMIDMQIGFGIVNVFDVQNNTQIPMVGNLLNIILVIIFFSVNGHHRLIEIMRITLEQLPVGNLTLRPEIGLVALEVFALTFVLGVMVALPVVASGLIMEICFGMLMRTVPQLNVFVVGIPIKLFVGFVILTFCIPAFVYFSDRIFTEMFAGVEQMFATFMAAP